MPRLQHVAANLLALLLALPAMSATRLPSQPSARTAEHAQGTSAEHAERKTTASARTRRKAAYRQWRKTSVATLVARNDTDSLLAAAVITNHIQLRGRLLREALKHAPNDADVAWAEWWFCPQISGCDPAKSLAHIRKLEPDNAAAWLPTVGAALHAAEPSAVDKALAHLARLNRLDDHAFAIARRTELALESLPPPPVQHALALTDTLADVDMHRISEAGISDVSAVVHACMNRTHVLARHAYCIHAARLLTHGGRLMYETLGSALATAEVSVQTIGKRSQRPSEATLRSRARRAIQQQLAVLWRTRRWSNTTATAWKRPALARTWQAAIRSTHSESAMVDTVLKARGIALQPPTRWRRRELQSLNRGYKSKMSERH